MSYEELTPNEQAQVTQEVYKMLPGSAFDFGGRKSDHFEAGV